LIRIFRPKNIYSVDRRLHSFFQVPRAERAALRKEEDEVNARIKNAKKELDDAKNWTPSPTKGSPTKGGSPLKSPLKQNNKEGADLPAHLELPCRAFERRYSCPGVSDETHLESKPENDAVKAPVKADPEAGASLPVSSLSSLSSAVPVEETEALERVMHAMKVKSSK